MGGGKYTEVVELKLLKTEEGFLRDVWEDWDEDINYDFTENPLRALRFYGYSIAPKYLYDHVNERSIHTIEEACAFLKGKMVDVEVTIEKTWKETDAK